MRNKDNFNFWMPIEIEKSKNEKDEIVMKIKGIASTPEEDSEGEILEPIGFDLDRFLKIGFINWNHQAKNDASKIIGEPTVARINKKGELYVEGTLYNNHPLARSVWELGEVLEQNGSKRKLGFSIEGRALERDSINPKRIVKALVTGLAITPTPVNASSYLDIVKGTQKEDYVDYEFEEDNDIHKAKRAKFLYEFHVGKKLYGINKAFDCVEIKKGEDDVEECSTTDIEKSPDTAAKAKVKKVMHEFKTGVLKTSAGKVVTDRKQAIAIAMSEAGISDKSFDDYMKEDDGVEKTMDVASTTSLVPESLDKKVKVLEPVIRKAIMNGTIPVGKLGKILNHF